MLKIVSENFIYALLLFLGLFLKISRWVPLSVFLTPVDGFFPDFLRAQKIARVNEGKII